MKNSILTMPEIFKNPKYRGKHVVLVAGKIYTAKTSAEVTSILKKTEKQYPNDTPEYAYLPKIQSSTFLQKTHGNF